jgi:hypothetical protein
VARARCGRGSPLPSSIPRALSTPRSKTIAESRDNALVLRRRAGEA